MQILLLSACLDGFLDTPYVLATGLGTVTSIAFERVGHGADGSAHEDEVALFAATDRGMVWIDGNGMVTAVPNGVPTAAVGRPAEDGLIVRETSIVAGPTHRVLASGLADPRAAAVDANGRVYVACGADSTLFRVDPEPGGTNQLTAVSRHLGDVRDLAFGIGGLFPPENLYIADGSGSITYVRPAEK